MIKLHGHRNTIILYYLVLIISCSVIDEKQNKGRKYQKIKAILKWNSSTILIRLFVVS